MKNINIIITKCNNLFIKNLQLVNNTIKTNEKIQQPLNLELREQLN